MQDFVHLHVHTYYSILDGQSSIQKLVDKAVADGMRGMAITDHGDMFGIKEFWDCCASVNSKRKKEGLEPFKPILGCEMYVAHHRKRGPAGQGGPQRIPPHSAGEELPGLQEPDKARVELLDRRLLHAPRAPTAPTSSATARG